MDLGELVAAGNTAQLYLSNGRIIKLFFANAPDSVSEREAQKQNAAYACGVPVPEVFDVTEIGGRQAIVMDYVEGWSLGSRAVSDPSEAARLLEQSVAIQKSLHEKTPENLESMRDKLERQLKSAPLSDILREKLLAQLISMPFKNRLCHGDYHLFNLLQAKDKIVVIDWVDATAGAPLADVCRSYLLYLCDPSGLSDLYLDLYCNHSNVSRDDVLFWLPIVAGARLSENLPPEQSDPLLEIICRYL